MEEAPRKQVHDVMDSAIRGNNGADDGSDEDDWWSFPEGGIMGKKGDFYTKSSIMGNFKVLGC